MSLEVWLLLSLLPSGQAIISCLLIRVGGILAIFCEQKLCAAVLGSGVKIFLRMDMYYVIQRLSEEILFVETLGENTVL